MKCRRLFYQCGAMASPPPSDGQTRVSGKQVEKLNGAWSFILPGRLLFLREAMVHIPFKVHSSNMVVTKCARQSVMDTHAERYYQKLVAERQAFEFRARCSAERKTRRSMTISLPCGYQLILLG